jgi:hypothetical protein
MTGTRVCVKNVPKHVTEARLKEHFAAKGEVTDVKLLKTRSAAAPFPSRLLVSPPGGGRSGAARVRQAVAGACCYVHACPCDRVYLRSSRRAAIPRPTCTLKQAAGGPQRWQIQADGVSGLPLCGAGGDGGDFLQPHVPRHVQVAGGGALPRPALVTCCVALRVGERELRVQLWLTAAEGGKRSRAALCHRRLQQRSHTLRVTSWVCA